MTQQVLDYRTPARPQSIRVVWIAVAIAAGITVAVNALLLWTAAADASWGAFGIMMLIGPIANGVLALASLPFIPLVRKLSGGAPTSPYVLTGLLGPVAAVVFDAACILGMPLHGC